MDPFGPDNKLIFATSVITGVPVPGMCKYSVAAKSPLTNGFGEAEAGGFFGPELKFAGFDALVIEGMADRPVYIWVHDGFVKLRDAQQMWGKPTKETQETIRKELDDQLVRIASIGPAGERLVRFACTVNELKFANGRSGLGAVMGSKRLKAVAVRSHKRLETSDEQKLRELAKWFSENWKAFLGAVSRCSYGTADTLMPVNMDGTLPTKNFRGGSFEYAESISGETMRDTILVGTEGCYACPIR